MKKILFVLIVILNLLFVVGCSKPSISISGESNIELGCSIVLKHNYTGSEEVVWTSSYPAGASVTKTEENSAVVVGNEIGEVIITVTAGSLSTSKVISVVAPVIEISIEGENALVVGSKRSLLLIYQKKLEAVKWSTSNASIATVSEDGTVSALSEGEVVITASVYDNKTDFKLVVTKKAPYEFH